MYLKVSPNKVHKTVEIEPETFVDVDNHGKLVGIEFLNPCNIDIGIDEIVKVFKSPQLDELKYGKLTQAIQAIGNAVASRN